MEAADKVRTQYGSSYFLNNVECIVTVICLVRMPNKFFRIGRTRPLCTILLY